MDNINNYSINAEIVDSGTEILPPSNKKPLVFLGVCSEKGEKYAIYVIAVSCTPLISHGNPVDNQKREWNTYRRYSEFNDLDITIRKRYPDLRNYVRLPNKSFMHSTTAEVREKRQKELNDYLSVSQRMIFFNKINIFSFVGFNPNSSIIISSAA